MDNLNEKFLNVTLKNAHEEHEEEQISISIVGILKNLRRFFALWLSATIFASILALVATSLAKQDSYKKMVSLVSFTYDGVEKGLDPNGNEFNSKVLRLLKKLLMNLVLTQKCLKTLERIFLLKVSSQRMLLKNLLLTRISLMRTPTTLFLQ